MLNKFFKILTLKTNLTAINKFKKVFSFFRLTGYFYKKVKIAPSVKCWGVFIFI